jgi:predicted transcriptional regulator YdeE
MAMNPQFQQAHADRLDHCVALTDEEKAGLKDLMIELNWPQHTYLLKTLMEDLYETTYLQSC